MPGLFKLFRYQVEWTNSDGVFKTKRTYLERTAKKYAELLEKAHGYKAVVREL